MNEAKQYNCIHSKVEPHSIHYCNMAVYIHRNKRNKGTCAHHKHITLPKCISPVKQKVLIVCHCASTSSMPVSGLSLPGIAKCIATIPTINMKLLIKAWQSLLLKILSKKTLANESSTHLVIFCHTMNLGEACKCNCYKCTN